MAARGTEHRQRVSLSACVEKREREKHTSGTAPDVNRCFTFSGLSVLCPVGSCKSRLSCSSFWVLCITTQHPPRVPKGRSEPWSADPESSHFICSLSRWVLPSSLLPRRASQGDPWVLQWDPGSPGSSPWLPAALPPGPRGRWGGGGDKGPGATSCTRQEAA